MTGSPRVSIGNPLSRPLDRLSMQRSTFFRPSISTDDASRTILFSSHAKMAATKRVSWEMENFILLYILFVGRRMIWRMPEKDCFWSDEKKHLCEEFRLHVLALELPQLSAVNVGAIRETVTDLMSHSRKFTLIRMTWSLRRACDYWQDQHRRIGTGELRS